LATVKLRRNGSHRATLGRRKSDTRQRRMWKWE